MAKVRRNSKKKNIAVKLVGLFVAVLVLVALAVVMNQAIDSRSTVDVASYTAQDDINTVKIGGVRCRKKTRIKTYLFMGVDARGKVGEHVEEDGAGQCDMLELVVIDQNADTYKVLPINRDTVTAVKSLLPNGTYLATTDVQIALAHAKGDGREISCENTVDAVSNLLMGQPIDGYLALNMDSIATINHMLGGVTVTIEDDFSETAPDLKIGETVKLTDEQAVHFVHDRMYVGDGLNPGRMRRQKQYLDSAAVILKEKVSASERYAQDFYDALGDYMVTSLSGKDFSKLAKAFTKNEFLGEVELTGESSLDELGFMQFEVDKESVAQAVLELFYERV